MDSRLLPTLCAALAITVPALADAEDRYFIRGGPAYANFDASAHVSVNGTEVPGGDVSVHYNTGASLEVGMVLGANWQVALTLGVPPRARIFGAGTLASAGKLGELNYAPAVLAVLFAPDTGGALRPYIGGGINYTWLYHRRGSTLQNLQVANAGGPALQFGAEYRLSPQVAWYLDIKKIWLKTNASGELSTAAGAATATARVTLDPMILSTGLSFHF